MTRTQTIDSIAARCVEEGDCLLWTGGCDGHGRPKCRHDGRSDYVRRVMRELVDGKRIPPGKVVAAQCGNKLCVSANCSVIGTDKTRGALAAKRGAYTSAAKAARIAVARAAQSRFDPATIQMVRDHPGPSRAAARDAGMSSSYARAIRAGKVRRAATINPFAGLLT